jgi:hypothetical protein
MPKAPVSLSEILKNAAVQKSSVKKIVTDCFCRKKHPRQMFRMARFRV